MSAKADIQPLETIENLVYLLRGQRVLLDFDLAALYGVEARVLNQAVKRNAERFPSDFMFQLSIEEMALLREARTLGNSSQIVMSSSRARRTKSQKIVSSLSRRGAAYRFYAFTEQGVAMLSSVLRSPRAVRVNIEIMRAFIRLRQWLASNGELTRKLDSLEKKYDAQFKVIFKAIRELMDDELPVAPVREIGFHTIRAPIKPATKAKSKYLKPGTTQRQ